MQVAEVMYSNFVLSLFHRIMKKLSKSSVFKSIGEKIWEWRSGVKWHEKAQIGVPRCYLRHSLSQSNQSLHSSIIIWIPLCGEGLWRSSNGITACQTLVLQSTWWHESSLWIFHLSGFREALGLSERLLQ